MKIFETFKCSGQNLSNSLCQFWNDKSIPLQILHSSSISWKVTPLYLFSSNNICFGQKEIIKVKTFEILNCSGQHLSDSLCNFEITSRFLSKSCIRIQFHERQLLCTFLAQTIYTFFERSSLKWTFLRLSNAQVIICQIPYVSLKRQVDSSPNFYPSSVSWKITPLYFISSNSVCFDQKEIIKVKIFGTFECSGQNLSNSLCQFWNDKSIRLQILYPSSVW